MDERLTSLIEDYLQAVRTALTLMQNREFLFPTPLANGLTQIYRISQA